MRLDKFISHACGLSREESRRAIREGRVSVDGVPARSAATQLPSAGPGLPGNNILLDGHPIAIPGPRYLMLNKPAGYLCATTDSQHPTVLDLLPAELKPELRIAGRLDLDTTGLLLLSTDGNWLHRISSPKRDCVKTYLVTLHSPLDEEALESLRQGVMLRGEAHPTRPALCQRLDDGRLSLGISEGRYHQVKRMIAACGNRVLALQRQQIGHVSLDPSLAPGEYRPLTEQEIAGF